MMGPPDLDVEGSPMSCYMRHMAWLFEALELPYDKEHRTLLDGAIRDALQTPMDAHCPEVWASIKALSPDERIGLIGEVRARITA